VSHYMGESQNSIIFFCRLTEMIAGVKFRRSNLTWVRLFSTVHMSTSESFSTLGLKFGSGTDAIKEAYRKLAKVHHPDLGGSSDRFVRIQKAYENLMDSSNNTSSRSTKASSDSSSSSSSYWRTWDSTGTWWNPSHSHRYTPEEDFDAEFEAQWQKFNSQRRSEKTGRKRYRAKSNSSESDESQSEGMDQEDAYTHQKDDNRESGRREGRGGRGRPHRHEDSPSHKVSVFSDDGRRSHLITQLTGEYDQVAKFNGRICYVNRVKNMFVFWSNKHSDWKISTQLKDDGNCVAFYSKNTNNPWSSDNSKWMVWSDRARRYVPAALPNKPAQIDFSTWTVSRLRTALEEMGLCDEIESVFEKSKLIEMMEMWSQIKGEKTWWKRKDEKSSVVSEGQFQICSRQRHDGVIQAPPILSERCKVSKNRVESFTGPMEELDEWIYMHGDRRRFYGVYDHENNYCFGLIWKDNKHWGRAGKHDY